MEWDQALLGIGVEAYIFLFREESSANVIHISVHVRLEIFIMRRRTGPGLGAKAKDGNLLRVRQRCGENDDTEKEMRVY